MAKNSYIEPGDAGFSTQLLTFRNGVPPYVTVLGLTPEQVSGQSDDADYYQYILAGHTVIQNAASQWTSWKKIIRGGGSPPPTGAPVAPELPAEVTATAAGIEGRFRNLVRLVKAQPGYNDGIGQALDIVGSEQSGADLDTIAPELSVTLAGGHVNVGWGWQGHGGELDLIEIHVDRGNGYVLLTYDTTPGYTDTTPLPAASAKWTYKAIYRIGDSQVGQWSPETSITVGG